MYHEFHFKKDWSIVIVFAFFAFFLSFSTILPILKEGGAHEPLYNVMLLCSFGSVLITLIMGFVIARSKEKVIKITPDYIETEKKEKIFWKDVGCAYKISFGLGLKFIVLADDENVVLSKEEVGPVNELYSVNCGYFSKKDRLLFERMLKERVAVCDFKGLL